MAKKMLNFTYQVPLSFLGRYVRYISDTSEDMTVVATQIGLSMNNAKNTYMVNIKDNNNKPKETEIMGKM
jgi:hypothetical protein